MGRSLFDQDTQVHSSLSYVDNRAPTEANYETNATDLEYDLNSVRSMLHELRDVRTSNWWAALLAPTTYPGEGAAARGVQDVNEDLYDIERKRILKRRAVVGADIVVPSALKAAGQLTTDTKANFTDAQTFTLNDGTQAATVFEIDTDGGGVTPGNVQVDISGDVTADDVRDTIIAAVNGVGAGLLITASSGGAATVTLQNNNNGTRGNVAITHNITAPAWAASGMTGGSGDLVILGAGELPGTAIAAIGGSTKTGTVVAYNATFGVATLDEVTGGDTLTPKNLAKIADAATGLPVLDGLGNEIHALLQYENNTDGSAITASTPNRAQLVFVVHNATNDDLIYADPQYIGGQTIDYSPVERYAFEDIPEHAWLGDDFVDAGGGAVTRQDIYNNQGITPVELGTNAILDLNSAGIYWSIRDLLNADLFVVTEGSGGGTSKIEFAAGVDLFDNNAVSNLFAGPLTVDDDGTDIEIGVTAGQINTLGANNLTLLGAGELFLDDGNRTASDFSVPLKVTEDDLEWDALEAAFGEVSLASMLLQAYNSQTRDKAHANVITADIPANTLITGAGGGANISAQMPSYKGLNFEEDVEVFINGALQRPGANAGVNNDVYPSAVAGEQATGDFYAEFVLRYRGGLNPDVVQMIVYGTPTP
jgi:hypothetical protein